MSPRVLDRKPLQQTPLDLGFLLDALPHPVLVVDRESFIVYSNGAAESFLSMSANVLSRLRLEEVVAFGCPLLSLVEQVRNTGSTVNEYGVEMASPRFASPKLVDVYSGPMPEQPNISSLCCSSAPWRR